MERRKRSKTVETVLIVYYIYTHSYIYRQAALTTHFQRVEECTEGTYSCTVAGTAEAIFTNNSRTLFAKCSQTYSYLSGRVGGGGGGRPASLLMPHPLTLPYTLLYICTVHELYSRTVGEYRLRGVSRLALPTIHLPDLQITSTFSVKYFYSILKFTFIHHARHCESYSVIATTLRYVFALLHKALSLWRNVIASDS
jgi:hypothetical protein